MKNNYLKFKLLNEKTCFKENIFKKIIKCPKCKHIICLNYMITYYLLVSNSLCVFCNYNLKYLQTKKKNTIKNKYLIKLNLFFY